MSIGTLIYTWLRGELVGADRFGNRYYRDRKRRLHGRERRWVVYKGRPEASKVPPEWHPWLHHTVAEPLAERAEGEPAWRREHRPNLTGTLAAHRPRGHELRGGVRAPSAADIQAWSPE